MVCHSRMTAVLFSDFRGSGCLFRAGRQLRFFRLSTLFEVNWHAVLSVYGRNLSGRDRDRL